jgi:hypothetical protein
VVAYSKRKTIGKCGDGNIILKQFPDNILHACELHFTCSEKAPNVNNLITSDGEFVDYVNNHNLLKNILHHAVC